MKKKIRTRLRLMLANKGISQLTRNGPFRVNHYRRIKRAYQSGGWAAARGYAKREGEYGGQNASTSQADSPKSIHFRTNGHGYVIQRRSSGTSIHAPAIS